VVRRILGIGVPRITWHGATARLGRPVSRLHSAQLASYPHCARHTSRYALPARFPWFGPHPARVCGHVRPQRHRESFFTPSRSVASRPDRLGLHRQLPVPGGYAPLLFVIVLSHSRALWASLSSICRCIPFAARLARGKALGGSRASGSSTIPKTVVLERVGHAARFHPTLLSMCAEMPHSLACVASVSSHKAVSSAPFATCATVPRWPHHPQRGR